jgi:hypothetical protein
MIVPRVEGHQMVVVEYDAADVESQMEHQTAGSPAVLKSERRDL